MTQLTTILERAGRIVEEVEAQKGRELSDAERERLIGPMLQRAGTNMAAFQRAARVKQKRVEPKERAAFTRAGFLTPPKPGTYTKEDLRAWAKDHPEGAARYEAKLASQEKWQRRREHAEQVASRLAHGVGRGIELTARAAAPHVWSATKEVASLTLGEVSAEARAFAEKQRAQRAIKRSPEWAETRATAEMTARVAREAESQKARAARHIESQRARTAEHAALVRARAAERLPATMPMRSVVERRLMERAGLRDMPEIYFGPQSVSPFGATPLGGRLPGTRPQPYAPDAWISPQQPMFVMSQQTPITIAPQFEQQMPVHFAPDITVDTDIESRPIVDLDLDFEIDLDQVLHSRRAATRRKAKPRATEQPQPGAGTLRLL